LFSAHYPESFFPIATFAGCMPAAAFTGHRRCADHRSTELGTSTPVNCDSAVQLDVSYSQLPGSARGRLVERRQDQNDVDYLPSAPCGHVFCYESLSIKAGDAGPGVRCRVGTNRTAESRVAARA